MTAPVPLNVGKECLVRILRGEPFFDDAQGLVAISKKDYEEMLKAKRNAEYLEKIDCGIAQLEAGKGQQHELIEVPADE